MIVCVPVTEDGLVGHSWGRAPRVALADVRDGAVASWQEVDVGWDELHDAGTEGSHHARVARFLRENAVEAVVAHHMGQGMAHMLDKLGISVALGAEGPARDAVTA